MPFELDITESVTYKLGEASGEAKSLILMLETLFGPLPDGILSQITHASKDDVEKWIVLALRAQSLSEVFSN